MFPKATINRCLFFLILSTQFLQCNNGQTIDAIPNLNFEEWEENSLQDDPFLMADTTHKIANAKVGKLTGWSAFGQSAVRTTDAFEGDYALVVNSWYGTGPGVVDLGQCRVTNRSQACGMPFQGRLNKLNGHYKLVAGSTQDNHVLRGSVAVYSFRYNAASQKRDTVALGQLFLEPTEEYTPFEFKINTILEDVLSDSIAVVFRVDGSDCQHGKCNYFYLDNLEIQGETTLECPYHGWRFGTDGVCRLMPSL
ncbi:MAG: Rieske (2Fe-2S) protein, partial [Bacteroidota bacterium]